MCIKNRLLTLLLCVMSLASCSDIEITMPKGPKGDAGMSAYEVWKENVLNGTIVWNKSEVEVVDFFKFLKGADGKDGRDGLDGKDGADGISGKSAYEVWKEELAAGTINDPMHSGKKWDPTMNSIQDFWRFLTGASGEDGQTPHIGSNGNWFIGSMDTGVPARGKDGAKGQDAQPPVVTIGDNGNWYVDGVDTGKPSRGVAGHTPDVTIGENGNWYVDGIDTHKPAKGADGVSPAVAIGENGNWYINGKDTGVPAYGKDGKNGTNGKDGIDGKDGSVVTIGANGNWFINGTDTGVPARGKDGVKGNDGTTPVVTIGTNGNWFIDGVDTGKPARGADGKDGTNGTNGANGKSAYELWVEEVHKGDLKDPHNPGQNWPITSDTLSDFWIYLSGQNTDQESEEISVLIGQFNVIPQYYNASTHQYVNLANGSVKFQVYDRTGAAAPAGAVVKGLPGIDASKSYTTDAKGFITIPKEDLPENLSYAKRKGSTASVTINGVTEPSATNTLVPNRVHTRIVLATAPTFGRYLADFYDDKYQNDIIRVQFKIEKQVNGVWQSIEDDKSATTKREVKSVLIKNINNEIDGNNIVDATEIGRTVACWLTSPSDNLSLLQRPVVYTSDEINWNGVDASGKVEAHAKNRLSKTNGKLYAQWDGATHYATLQAYNNCYGEKPVMNAAILMPEINPVCDIVNNTIEVTTGHTNLHGELATSQLSYYYDAFAEPTTGVIWKTTGKKTYSNDYLGSETEGQLSICMNKATAGNTGVSFTTVKTFETKAFTLDSAYPDNELMICGYNAENGNTPAMYRAVCRYIELENSGTYYLYNFLTNQYTGLSAWTGSRAARYFKSKIRR